MTSQRAMRWILLLEEYGSEITDIKGVNNVITCLLLGHNGNLTLWFPGVVKTECNKIS